MNELNLLRALLLLSLAVAPLLTHRALLPPSNRRGVGHALAFACAAAGLLTPASLLCGVWLIFCVGSLVEFLLRAPRSLQSLAGVVPMTFSVIAGIWLLGGTNELHILGYGETFSYYAALHGNVLGWMLVGSIAVLATHGVRYRRLYFAATLVSFVSFLLVAIGIALLPALKPVGVLGLSLVIPIAQLAFLRSTWRVHTPAFVLGLLSILGLAFTLTLAWQNQLGVVSLPPALGVRPMVSIHGLINGVLVVPSFMLAVRLSLPRSLQN